MFSPTSSRVLTTRIARSVAAGRLPIQQAVMMSSTWSGSLSFASPESDFCIQSTANRNETVVSANHYSTAATASSSSTAEWSGLLSYASPESDFASYNPHQATRQMTATAYQPTSVTPAPAMPFWSGNISFASPESDFCGDVQYPQPLTLPTTLAEAMSSSQAVVVTTVDAPHKIVHVNQAWIDLCGYTKQEVLNKTLAIIQGRETNKQLAEDTVQSVCQHLMKQADVYLINYKKNGSPFTNHVRMGTMKLSEDEPDVEFLVGVLEEVNRDQVPLRFVH